MSDLLKGLDRDRILEGISEAFPFSLIPGEVSQWFAKQADKSAWLVTCSGGADSVALLLWLKSQFPDRELRIFHMDHGVRAESSRDATFVEELAGWLELPVNVGKPECTLASPTEAELRQMRRTSILAEASACGASAVFTGHQADDVLENLLFRLARGSGLDGLSGMRPVQVFSGQPTFVRPLLNWNRSEIRLQLRRLGVSWREDGSNQGFDYARNRLRNLVVPALESAMPDRDVPSAALQVHRELREADQSLDWMASEVALRNRLDLSQAALPASVFERLPRAVTRRILSHWLKPFRLFPGRSVSEAILDCLESGSEATWDLSGYWLSLTSEQLSLTGKDNPVTWSPFCLVSGIRVFFPDHSCLALEAIDLAATDRERILSGNVDPGTECYLSADSVGTKLNIRRWAEGDRYLPLGSPGSRKLQDCFVDRQIEVKIRHLLPVVVSPQGEILWVPGLLPADGAKIRGKTVRALRLTYRPG